MERAERKSLTNISTEQNLKLDDFPNEKVITSTQTLIDRHQSKKETKLGKIWKEYIKISGDVIDIKLIKEGKLETIYEDLAWLPLS